MKLDATRSRSHPERGDFTVLVVEKGEKILVERTEGKLQAYFRGVLHTRVLYLKKGFKKRKGWSLLPESQCIWGYRFFTGWKENERRRRQFLLAWQVVYNGNRKNRNGEGQGPLWRSLTSRIYLGTPFARKNCMAWVAAASLA